MKNLLLCLALLSAPFVLADQYAAAPIISTPPYTTVLLPGVCLTKTYACVISGNVDPTVTAVSAPAGSIYLSTLTNGAYTKQDAGSSTNWHLLTTAETGTGTVTSVGLSLPNTLFSVAGSPVTTYGTLSASLTNQAPNTVFAGPGSGAASAPTFRGLTAADLPNAPAVLFTTSYTATSADKYIFSNATGGTVLYLPDATTPGQVLFVKNLNTGTLTINPLSGQFIDGNSVYGLNSKNQAIQLVSQGGQWWVF